MNTLNRMEPIFILRGATEGAISLISCNVIQRNQEYCFVDAGYTHDRHAEGFPITHSVFSLFINCLCSKHKQITRPNESPNG
jgi:hypothetical protein